MQHPTFRDEIAGRDAVVLTRPGTLGPRRARSRVPANRDVLVIAGSPEGPVIAEVGVHDRVRTLNVRAGNYFVRERSRLICSRAASRSWRARSASSMKPR